jgi:hypothetical protein
MPVCVCVCALEMLLFGLEKGCRITEKGQFSWDSQNPQAVGCGTGVVTECIQSTWSNQVSDGGVVEQVYMYLVGCSVPVAHMSIWHYHVH